MIFEKFIRKYIEFLNENFNINEHSFYVIGKDDKGFNLDGLPQVKVVDSIKKIPSLMLAMNRADKIILHGLWHKGVIKMLLWQPWLIKKCYWMMWGGDFYNYKNEPVIKKRIIKKIRHFVCIGKDEFEFVKKRYYTNGVHHECILYPVQLYDNNQTNNETKNHTNIQILLGNSADPSNDHIEALEILKSYRSEDIQIYCPLSYGNKLYAEQVILSGKKIFADKFIPLKEFMSYENYSEILNRIDIGIFNHSRQQALGNITGLLARGKKVYLKKENPLFNILLELGAEVYNIKYFDLTPIESVSRDKNLSLMKNYFSKENYISQLKKLFYS